jgi:hypothetical protein
MVGPDLATVPHRAAHAILARLRPRRHHLPALPARRDRAPHPPGAPRRDHRPPHRSLSHPAGPQPAHGPRGPRQPVSVSDPRPGQQIHRRLRRRVRRRSDISTIRSPVRAPRAKRHSGALDRHPASRMPRPGPDDRTVPPRGGASGVRRALQHAPPAPAPVTRSAPARRPHSPALRRDRPTTATRPPRRSHSRVPALSHEVRRDHGTHSQKPRTYP